MNGNEERATEFLRASHSARERAHADVVVVRRAESQYSARGKTGEETEKQLVLSPTAVAGSQEYEDAQKRLQDAGVRITGAASSTLASTINVSTTLSAEDLASIVPGTFTVVNKPRARPKALLHGVDAYFPGDGGCGPDSNVLKQATMVDQLKGRMSPANRGAGVMVIVWDFLPVKPVPADLQNRRGGPLVVYRNDSQAVDMHGVFVASLVGGLKSGLVTDSKLVLLGVNDVLSDLAVIKKLADSFSGPVVVNFSVAMEFMNNSTDAVLQQTQQQCALYDAAVNKIKAENKRIIFVCAAGNENLDLCSATGGLSWGECTDCVCWPQNRFGSDTPGPFLQVGATKVDPSGIRKKANYSNFGRCIDVFSHGGNICGYDENTASYISQQGTSFSSPSVSAILAAIASLDIAKMTADAAISTLRSAQQQLVTGVAATTTKAFAFVPDTVVLDPSSDDSKDVVYEDLPEEDAIVVVVRDDGSDDNNGSRLKSIALGLLVLCILFVIFFLLLRKKES